METKKVVLSDVAKLASVSPSLVSRYMRGLSVSEKRAKVIQAAIEELGYVHNAIAGNLSAGTSKVVGIVVPYIDDSYYAEIIQYIHDYVMAQGYWLQVGCSNYDPKIEESAVRSILGWNPSAVVLCGDIHTNRTIELLNNSKSKVIQAVDIQGDAIESRVGLDHIKIGRDMASHLLNGGCKKLAVITVNTDRDIPAQRRVEGIKAMCLDKGIAEPLVITIPYSLDLFKPAGDALLDILVNEPEIDGICATDDVLAVGVLMEANNRNIAVPERMAVLGYGNTRLGYAIRPSLSTIDPYASMMATEIAKITIGQVNNFPKEEIVEVGYRVVPRQSTKV